jgi:hypothetical protein
MSSREGRSGGSLNGRLCQSPLLNSTSLGSPASHIAGNDSQFGGFCEAWHAAKESDARGGGENMNVNE